MERLWRIFALVAASAAIGYLTTAWVRDQMRPSAAIRTTSRLPDSRQADTASRFTSSRLAARVSSIARSCRAGLHRYAGAPPLTRASRERSSPAIAEQVLETGRSQWTPIVDGVEVPDQPRALFEQGAFARVPTRRAVLRV